MDLSFKTRRVKMVLFVINVIFFILGICIIAVGAVTYGYATFYSRLFKVGDFSVAPTVLMIGGAVILVIAGIGCYASLKLSRPALYIYATFMLVIFCMEISAGVTALMFQQNIDDVFNEKFLVVMSEYQLGKHQVDKMIDTLQLNMKCCGASNYSDWEHIPSWADRFPQSVPDSCCIHGYPACGAHKLTTGEAIYTDGCMEKLKTFIMSKAYLIGGLGLAVAIFELAGIVLAFFLANLAKTEVV